MLESSVLIFVLSLCGEAQAAVFYNEINNRATIVREFSTESRINLLHIVNDNPGVNLEISNKRDYYCS